MKSILEEFAYGNIITEPHFFEKDSRYARALQKIVDCEDKLISMLNDEGKEVLKQFIDSQAEINLISGVDRFKYGYKLGVLMTAEVFNGKQDLIIGEK
jgi:hypothetical protein